MKIINLYVYIMYLILKSMNNTINKKKMKIINKFTARRTCIWFYSKSNISFYPESPFRK